MQIQAASPVNQLQGKLHEALAPIGRLGDCALLHYPNHFNIGDHLIWLGSLLYLTQVAEAHIGYTASFRSFSAGALERTVGKVPLLLLGGGNLGDLWPKEQLFRESVIQRYHDRPITILPQSIFFQNPDHALRASQIFNAHPDLTIFLRDIVSYKLAQQYFDNCRLFLAPDLAFALHPLPSLPLPPPSESTILYHTRKDKECNRRFDLESMGKSRIVKQDWGALNWLSPLLKPLAERQSCQIWQQPERYPAQLLQAASPKLQQRSWRFLHQGMYQLAPHSLVVTDRLHGHILATLMEIPNVLLANAYHKNEAFYQTWTKDIPFCRFAKDPISLKRALQELSVDMHTNPVSR